MGTIRQSFSQKHYLDELQEGKSEVGDSGNPLDIPKWLDMEKFNRGRQFFKDHFASNFLAMFTSLAFGLSVSNLLEPLVFTGQSDSPRKSLKRYLRTFLHIVQWHYGDVWNTNTEAHKSVAAVRKIHNEVAKQMNRPDIENKQNRTVTGDNVKTSARSNHLFISQYDMSLVQCGFMGSIILYPESFGVSGKQSELDDYVYFWKGIGYLLGISDKYNICNRGYTKARAIAKEIEQTIVIPAMLNPPPMFYPMCKAFLDGSNLFTNFNFFTPEMVFALAFDSFKMPWPQLTLLDYIRVYVFKILVFLIRYCPFCEKILNRMQEMALGCDKMN